MDSRQRCLGLASGVGQAAAGAWLLKLARGRAVVGGTHIIALISVPGPPTIMTQDPRALYMLQYGRAISRGRKEAGMNTTKEAVGLTASDNLYVITYILCL